MSADHWTASAAAFCTEQGQGPAVIVTMCGRNGWDVRRMSLRQFGRARANLERLDILAVYLVGALA